MAIICDFVILSRPLLILISHGSLMDSDEEREKYESLNVKLTLLLRSIKSDREGIAKVIGFDKTLLQLIIQNFPQSQGFGSKVSAHTRSNLLLTPVTSNKVRWPR